ncbi:hypothetical protein GCM10027184_55410 [Saccharothrix stipae]
MRRGESPPWIVSDDLWERIEPLLPVVPRRTRNEAGVWSRLHEVLLAELHSAGRLDRDRAVIDTSHVRTARRGPKADRVPPTAPDRAPSTTS